MIFWKKTAGMDPRSRFFFNFCDFCFSLSTFRTRFWPRGHVPRGCSGNEKERSWKADMFRHQNFENRTKIEGVMAVTIKTFQNTQCRQHLWSWIGMCNGDFVCHGHNSLNFGPIFKILVAKHSSGPRPFIWCAEHPRGTWPCASKRVLKLVHENQKLCFFDENQLLGVFPQTFFNGSPQRCTQSLSLKFGVIRTKTKKVMWVKSWNL